MNADKTKNDRLDYPDSANPLTLSEQFDHTFTAEYGGDSVDFSVIGERSPQRNPILLVPGFVQGRIALQNFAEALVEEGDRLVITPEQPRRKHRGGQKLSALDHQAEAMLAVVDNMNFSRQPLDVITHSFGSLIFVRAAELAKNRGWNCFEEPASHSVIIAPSGAYEDENIFRLGKRFTSLMLVGAPETDGPRSTTDILWPGPKNALSQPVKTVQEVMTINQAKIPFKKLGQIGIKPVILGLSNDSLYPDKLISPAIVANLDSLNGYATIIGNEFDIPAASFNEFKQKTGLSGKEAKSRWLAHYRNSNHNDPSYQSKKSAAAVLQVLDLLEKPVQPGRR